MELSSTNEHLLDAINILESICVPIICSIGILGNCLNLVVLSRSKLRQSVRSKQDKIVICTGLKALAVIDLFVCVSILPRAFVPAHEIFFKDWTFGLFYQVYGTPLISTFNHASAFMLVLLSGLRYIAICHPLRSLGLRIGRGFNAALSLLLFAAVAINIPGFWIHKVTSFAINGTSYLYVDIGSYSHVTHKGVIYAWLKSVCGLFLPVVLLAFFNCHLIRALRKSADLHCTHRVRAEMTNQWTAYRFNYNLSSASNPRTKTGWGRLTVTLVLVVVAFIVLVLPCELLHVVVHLTGLVEPNAKTVLMLRSIFTLMQVSNFALNFLFYNALNANFRRTLRAVFCSGQRKEQTHLHSSGSQSQLRRLETCQCQSRQLITSSTVLTTNV